MADDRASHTAQPSDWTGSDDEYNKQTGYETDSEVDSIEEDLFRSSKKVNAEAVQKQARKLYALDQLQKPVSPLISRHRRTKTKQ